MQINIFFIKKDKNPCEIFRHPIWSMSACLPFKKIKSAALSHEPFLIQLQTHSNYLSTQLSKAALWTNFSGQTHHKAVTWDAQKSGRILVITAYCSFFPDIILLMCSISFGKFSHRNSPTFLLMVFLLKLKWHSILIWLCFKTLSLIRGKNTVWGWQI